MGRSEKGVLMSKGFNPIYTIDARMAHNLMRIEAAKQQVNGLPLNPTVLASLRATSKLYTTHYSTMIEGNRLSPQEIQDVLTLNGHFPGKERDEREVKGYYAALEQLERYVKEGLSVSEIVIKTLHALVMAGGNARVKPTPYRDGQNVIKDSSGAIVYMPPEAKDVAELMEELVLWIKDNVALPSPIVAAIAHYQFATIHPYYDGNGRTARLLTTLILHHGGYDLKGIYSLDEYYAKNLTAYYQAISVGPSHNYYMGRAESDISAWIAYFIEGMAVASENVIKQMKKMQDQGGKDHTKLMRKLDPKQRQALELFRNHEVVTSSQIGTLFGYRPRTAAALCSSWVQSGFITIVNPSLKARKYALAAQYYDLLDL